jgi:hypothetical protein
MKKSVGFGARRAALKPARAAPDQVALTAGDAHTALQQKAPNLVDECCTALDQSLANPVQRLKVQLGLALEADRNAIYLAMPRSCPSCCQTGKIGIDQVIGPRVCAG